MSGDFADDSWAPPAFQPIEALHTLRNHLREVRGLNEQRTQEATGYAWSGQPVIELSIDATAAALNARLAKTPLRTPDWERFPIKSHADLRRFVDEVKKRTAHWQDD